jgi:hypothetical protein
MSIKFSVRRLISVSLALIILSPLSPFVEMLAERSAPSQLAAWTIEYVKSDLDNRADRGALALDSQGRPHVLVWNQTSKNLELATRWLDWQTEVIVNSPIVSHSKLVIDRYDVPHVAWTTPNGLWYGKWNVSYWAIELVDSKGINGILMTVDPLGYPHLAYEDSPSGATTIWYASWNATSWQITAAVTGSDLGVNGLALDSWNKPHILYTDVTLKVFYSRYDGSSWRNETVYDRPGEGSLAIDVSDKTHIAILELANGDLLYATRNETGWMTEVVDSVGKVGWNNWIALDEGGNPHISYQAADADDLKYSWWNGNGWLNETVDSMGTVGKYTSIAMGLGGHVHIVYTELVNLTRFRVKYASGLPEHDPPTSSINQPTPYWWNTSDILLVANAQGLIYPVVRVNLYYRVDNGTGWGGWTLYESDFSPPWEWSFTWPGGEGRYEFYSLAFDYSSVELKAPTNESSLGYDRTPPASFALPIHPYLQSASPIPVGANASDNLSGLSNVTLFYSFSSDNNVTWSAWTPFGTDSSVPWSWQFTFPDGVGHYRFHTIATDNASNVEGGKTIAEAVAGYGMMPDYLPLNPTPSSPLSIFTSSLLQLSVEVRNDGGIPASSISVLAFLDSVNPSSPFVTFQIPPLSPGETVGPFTADWTSPATLCSCTVTARVDYGNDLIESNESNNEYTWIVDVESAPVTAADYIPVQSEPASPLKIGLSTDIPLSILVHNQGNGTATDNAIVAFFQQSSPPFSRFVLSPLAPAANSTRFTATWTSPAIPGTYSVSVDVDYDDNVSEWDETNNEYTWTIEVVSGPVTSLVIGYPNYTSPAMTTYVKSTTHLSFTVLDQSGLGIRNTPYTVDGGNPVNYTATGTFFLAGEGVHKIEWQSLDWTGNLEEARSMNLTVDDTPPVTTIHKSEEQATTATVFTLTATDSGCGVNVTMYRIDGGSWAAYSGGFTLSEGEHNISYYSNDMLNNTEREKRFVVTVQGTTTPPETTVNHKPIVALLFATILLVAGVWSSKKRPWKGGKDRMAVVKAFVIFSLPFVLAEAGTGIVSLLTGQLSMPPIIGPGTGVDLTILLGGLLFLTLRSLRKDSPIDV